MKYRFSKSQLTTFSCHLHSPVKCPSERNGREDNLKQNSQTFLIFMHLINEACLNDTLPWLYPVQFSRLGCNHIPFSSWLKKQMIERNIIIVILISTLWRSQDSIRPWNSVNIGLYNDVDLFVHIWHRLWFYFFLFWDQWFTLVRRLMKAQHSSLLPQNEAKPSGP